MDKYVGKSYEHRKKWVEARVLELGEIFACGIHAWAVMSNHMHLVVHMNPAAANAWTSDEVAALGSFVSRSGAMRGGGRVD